ncbi:hypothetical protein TPB0596_10850 [Tsukamurella pulmonis]|uniref:Uncharacterized protein n=1 Tax=Tsukamurella pulmonis TaxID=47312 RepID=A0A1H1H1P4_9ACTN|nr:hypothetical protein [Tsukamurella pulmonis]KXO88103.1 hypothetical protein AXK56_12050 [Tsukamurella pulmonis]KXP13071.1 hypothetical protein AXK57_02225 [Tsukamurella pulmonis]RDH09987.1 hypothetical protein DVB88_20780 [Tsukamurella pulmonis]SDR19344.1 hypothetical protein SAMN04489765_3742 [Tsukamurella pulmonis]SUP16149.1 Uncharacterised protein [Tsukamurella pulmonis]
MSSRNPDPEDHARAVRIAERRDLFDELLRVTGVAPEPAEITQPIAVIPRAEEQRSWLTAY